MPNPNIPPTQAIPGVNLAALQAASTNALSLAAASTTPAASSTSGATSAAPPAAPLPAAPTATDALVKKAAAKKAAVASLASGAAPAAIPVIKTGFEVDDSENFINKLNLNNAVSIPQLISLSSPALLRISTIISKINSVASAARITTITPIFWSLNHDEVNKKLSDLAEMLARYSADIFSDGTLDSDVQYDLNHTIAHLMGLTQRLIFAIQATSNTILDAASKGGGSTGGGGGAGGGGAAGGPRTPGAPAVDPTALERQMNSEWDTLVSYIRNDDYTYEEKLAELESFVAEINADQYGDHTKGTIEAKLLEYNTLIRDCKSVEGNFTSSEVFASGNDVLRSANKIKRDAENTKKRIELEALITKASTLRNAFNTKVNKARTIEIEETYKDNKGKDRTRTKKTPVTNPLVFEAIYGNIRKQVNELISEDFFTAQETRISNLEKEDKALTEAKGRIDVAASACIAAITTSTSNINTILPGGGVITKKSWEKFYKGYNSELLFLQGNINKHANSIRSEVVANNKASTHALAKMAELAEKVNGFNRDYMYTSDTSMGIKMSPIHDKYKLVEGVADASGNVKYYATPFVPGAKINVPALEGNAAASGSPTPRGSASPYGATGGVNDNLNAVWRNASPWKRTLGIAGGVAVAAVLVAAALSVKKDDKNLGAKPRPVAAAPADATAAPRNSNAPNAQSTGSANNPNGRGVEANDRSATVDRMSSVQVLERIKLKTGESVTFAGGDILNRKNYNSIKSAGSGPNANAEEVLKYNTLAQLVSNMSSAPADDDYSVSRIRLLKFVLSEDPNFKPKNITAVSSTAALTHWALDTSRDAEKFVIYFYGKKIIIYLRGDTDWRKAIEETVRGHMVSGSSYDNPGILTDDEMDRLFNSTTTQKPWDVIEQAQSNGTLADIMKKKKAYFVKISK